MIMKRISKWKIMLVDLLIDCIVLEHCVITKSLVLNRKQSAILLKDWIFINFISIQVGSHQIAKHSVSSETWASSLSFTL